MDILDESDGAIPTFTQVQQYLRKEMQKKVKGRGILVTMRRFLS